MTLTENEQGIVGKIKAFAQGNHRLPSYSELAALLGFASKNAAYKLVTRLVDAGILVRDTTGRLKFGTIGGLPMAGTVQAGFPSPAEEDMADSLSLDDYLVRKPTSSFLLKVTGDSMIDAGIMQGDIVIVEKGTTPKSGDIVLAQVDRQWTLKYFSKKGRAVTLVAANKNYPDIHPKEELIIAGVVAAAVRRYK